MFDYLTEGEINWFHKNVPPGDYEHLLGHVGLLLNYKVWHQDKIAVSRSYMMVKPLNKPPIVLLNAKEPLLNWMKLFLKLMKVITGNVL